MDKVYKWYKIGNWCYLHHLSPISILVKRVMRIFFACDIHYKTAIGEGTVFVHDGLGVVIHRKAVIGTNYKILHGVTIGGRGGSGRTGLPIIGNNVLIGAHSMVLGPVIIGDNVTIGAGIVIHSIPANSIVVGNPARIISKNT